MPGEDFPSLVLKSHAMPWQGNDPAPQIRMRLVLPLHSLPAHRKQESQHEETLTIQIH